ncbi:MAG TPA: hypothetical protein GXZ98_01735 [Firmicutes bacterium]|nr:hypothetical protein [Bacillota bacterium]
METGKKIVQLVVDKDWTPETISSLGGGFFYHLSYPVEVIAPDLLAEIRAGRLPPGTELEILFRKEKVWRRVALAELDRLIDFQTFIRLEFRLLQTPPSLKEGPTNPINGYLLSYKKETRP